MPVSFEVDTQHRAVISRAWDTLTDGDLLEHQSQIEQNPSVQSDFNQLFDFREVTTVDLSSLGVRMLAGRNPFGEGAKRAFVVQPGALAMFGMMRMFQILTEDHPDELRVQFNEITAARAWVGLSEEMDDADGATA